MQDLSIDPMKENTQMKNMNMEKTLQLHVIRKMQTKTMGYHHKATAINKLILSLPNAGKATRIIIQC